uniref:Uncharacterized protein n=1 Tax=Oryza barthii TaxID=65489 RepID=A0A0D3G6P9_9ORYZ
MTHRQHRRIFLDYTSLFSSNCVLLRQFSLYASSPTLAYDSWWSPVSPARYWQHRCARSSRVVLGSGKPGVTSHSSRFDYISSSASSSSTIAVIVSPSSSLACLRAPLVHDALLCVHDYSTAPHALFAAWLPRHQLPDFGYIDHGYSTHGFIDHGSLGSFRAAAAIVEVAARRTRSRMPPAAGSGRGQSALNGFAGEARRRCRRSWTIGTSKGEWPEK